MKSGWKRNFIIYVIILAAAILLFSFIFQGPAEPEEIPLSQAIEMSKNK